MCINIYGETRIWIWRRFRGINNGHVTCNIFEKWWKILIVYGEETGRVRFSFDSNILYSLFYI